MRRNIITLSIILTIIVFLFFIIYPNAKLKQTNSKEIEKYKNKFSVDEYTYVLENNVDLDNLEKYLNYKNFNVYNYYEYENIRLSKNYTHLQSINSFRYPNYFESYINAKEALFKETRLVLVNKSFYLSNTFIPTNLVSVMNYNIEYMNIDIMAKREVLESLETMYMDALNEDIEFTLFSGFRSYNRQKYLFYEVYKDDTISAKPGHSEHQTGYAIDISVRDVGLTNQLENTNTYNWLIDNCHKYGFILRFPKDKTYITTYKFEPWHFRYVGSVATKIMEEGLTLEEYIFSNLEI